MIVIVGTVLPSGASEFTHGFFFSRVYGFIDHYLSFMTILLSVILRFTASEYPFGISKLFSPFFKRNVSTTDPISEYNS